MPVPPAPPAVVVTCPLRDTTHARVAGDSAAGRVKVEGYATLGIVTGLATGVSGLVVSAEKNPASVGVLMASVIGATANTVVASKDRSVAARDLERIVDCDDILKQSYKDAYGTRAQAKRGKWAFFTALLSAIFTVVAAVALLLVVLTSGGFYT